MVIADILNKLYGLGHFESSKQTKHLLKAGAELGQAQPMSAGASLAELRI